MKRYTKRKPCKQKPCKHKSYKRRSRGGGYSDGLAGSVAPGYLIHQAYNGPGKDCTGEVTRPGYIFHGSSSGLPGFSGGRRNRRTRGGIQLGIASESFGNTGVGAPGVGAPGVPTHPVGTVPPLSASTGGSPATAPATGGSPTPAPAPTGGSPTPATGGSPTPASTAPIAVQKGGAPLTGSPINLVPVIGSPINPTASTLPPPTAHFPKTLYENTIPPIFPRNIYPDNPYPDNPYPRFPQTGGRYGFFPEHLNTENGQGLGVFGRLPCDTGSFNQMNPNPAGVQSLTTASPIPPYSSFKGGRRSRRSRRTRGGNAELSSAFPAVNVGQPDSMRYYAPTAGYTHKFETFPAGGALPGLTLNIPYEARSFNQACIKGGSRRRRRGGYYPVAFNAAPVTDTSTLDNRSDFDGTKNGLPVKFGGSRRRRSRRRR